MISTLPTDLKKLWRLAGVKEQPTTDYNWNVYFDPIGLILLTPEEDYDRGCLIPINSLTFATTGGGSVHYSLLSLDKSFSNNSPVVMTVPNCESKRHMIVGENLRDFIGLGIRTGYRCMEDLAYDYNETGIPDTSLYPYTKDEFYGDFISSEQKKALLKALEIHFNAKRWINPKEKLKELEKKYHHQLHIDRSVLD